jgi:hypothetical protein
MIDKEKKEKNDLLKEIYESLGYIQAIKED